MKKVIRKKIEGLPNIDRSMALEMPVLDAEDYKKRICRLCEAGKEYTYFVVYGDKEHFSNIEYFTGFDPRFEEALLIIPRKGKPTLIVGDEGEGYAAKIIYDIQVEVYPVLGLPGQPSMHDTRLSDILAKTGITSKDKIGVMGWKCFSSLDFKDEKKVFDLPYFIMQSLLEIVPMENLYSVNDLMIANEYGLRHNLEAKELVMCEIYGTKSSRNVYRVLANLEEGIDEVTASEYLQIDGEPLIAHPNVNFGENNYYGLASCSPFKKLRQGELVGVGMSYRRSLCHKEAFYIKSEHEESEKLREFYNTYFQALTSWYETLGIGVTGEKVYESVEEITGNLPEFGIGLNPGHLIHTEEWTNSPFFKGCKDKLHSGMALQCDFTASRKDLGIAVHAEDGVVLADEDMQNEIRKIAPNAYERMMERRKFMVEILGIKIAPEVLPTSDMPAVIFPYLGDLSIVIANE